MTFSLKRLNSAEKVSTNVYWNRAAMDHRKIIPESTEMVNVTSKKKREFRTNNPSVATYEQIKKSLSYFYPKLMVDNGGIHTHPKN